MLDAVAWEYEYDNVLDGYHRGEIAGHAGSAAS
jgi:hypothetical protein